MKNERMICRALRLLLTVALLALVTVGCMVTVSADEIEWDLLQDKNGDFRLYSGSFGTNTDENGTLYVENTASSATIYVYDDNNVMGEYMTFSLECDVYFSAFPTGLRDGKTPEENPLSFLCWIYTNIGTGRPDKFNGIRIDNNGYLYTSSSATVKTDVKLELDKWYNIRCVFTPRNGICELWLDGEKMFDFKIEPYRTSKYSSYAVRYFDGFYSWGAKMKNVYLKTDSSYVVELKREEAADYLGYQVAKPEGDSFSLRGVFGVNGVDHSRVGYEVLLLDIDEDGRVITESISHKEQTIYETVHDSAGNVYNIKELYGYNYAAALEIPNVPIEPTGGSMEIVIRPYVLGNDGIRRYGLAQTLYYIGELDADGYPVLHKNEGKVYSTTCTDDTYIWNKAGNTTADYGSSTLFIFRNPGDANKDGYRACYFKFTLDAETVAQLETAASAKFRVYIPRVDGNTSRKLYDIVVHATDTDWDEHSLNFQNHGTMAAAREKVYQGPCRPAAYFTADVLQYLISEPLNDDGSLTVSFRITSEGFSDALEVYANSKETSYKPVIEISNSVYEVATNLEKMANAGYEPWGYAEALVDEWFEELQYEVWLADMFGDPIYHGDEPFAPNGYGATQATGDFTVPVRWLNNGFWTTSSTEGYKKGETYFRSDKFARTLATLGTSTANTFLDSSYAEMRAEYDSYGGITNAGFKGQATGFFHTEMYNGRAYIIDPLGYPYFAFGMNEVGIGGGNHVTYTLDVYGTEENYYEKITAELLELGVNTAFVSNNKELLQVEDSLAVAVGLDVVGAYMKRIGRAPITEGEFPFNNTMNVFDPDFITFSNEGVAQQILAGDYVGNPHVFGYTTDNELPSARDLLCNYLTLNPAEEATNAFSYAVAWTWLARRMETDNPTLDMYLSSPDHDRIAQEFFSFVYARYYKVAKDAIELTDPNHMYLGSRVAGDCKVNEGYHRAAGYYLDILTVNLYDGMNPAATTITDLYRNSGKPFIVTEFYAMSIDATDANGWLLASSHGAGAYTETLEERATYYEHYVLSLIESKACVGWIWYRFRDNDQTIYHSIDLDMDVIMLASTVGEIATPHTFMGEDGVIYTAQQVGFYDTVYQGNLINSNQNSNKGLYNNDFSSVVTVYEYGADGKLISSKGYEIEHPESEDLADGTVVNASESDLLFEIGTVTNADGSYTKTVLTVYRGRYVAFAKAIRSLSTHMIGLINYFDAQ